MYWSKSATKRVIQCPLISKMHHTNLTVTSKRQGELLKLICLWKQNEYLNCKSKFHFNFWWGVSYCNSSRTGIKCHILTSLKIHGCLSAAMAKFCRRSAWPSFPTHDFITNLIALNISCFAAEIAPKLAPPFDNRSSICQRHFSVNCWIENSAIDAILAYHLNIFVLAVEPSFKS